MTNLRKTSANLLPYQIELWFPVPGYEGLYQASTQGRVRSIRRSVGHSYGKCIKQGFVLKPSVCKKGYLKIKLYRETKTYSTRVHTIVALTFLPNPFKYDQINHKTGIKSDNRPFMLEWCNNQFNTDHRWKYLVDREKFAEKMRNPVRCKKIGESVRGARNPYAKKVIDESTGEVFGCVGDAAMKNGYSYNQLKQWLNGRRKNKSSLKYLTELKK